MGLLQGLLLAVPGAVAQGVLWGIMTLGVYITYKVLDYADLTVDGSFATGGAVTAILIVKGMNPFLSILFALVAGCIAGCITGMLHTKLKIPAILSGILSQLALYSINIRIMGKANTPLLGINTVVTEVKKWVPSLSDNTVALMLGLAVAAVVIVALYWVFGTELGCCIRATGNNEYMVRALGGNTDAMKIAGLMLSNGLVALSGAMVAQTQGYADVGMGIGAIVIGLASVIIGEVLMGKRFSFAYKLASVVVGSIVYRIIIAAVLQIGMKSTDLKLLTAIIVAIALSVPVFKSKFKLGKFPRKQAVR
ncbi:ABC transporter permease subunit [Hydrogenoanaerobacterium sp.]|uniref:ABC transporter permease n=1 Tax=Hydrogenoanaerobacterium sp. TaxID=2953763 RepID=UPI00289B02BD|nr:ABC transporter permease [Hydrogenoanaerobacterium sp.]